LVSKKSLRDKHKKKIIKKLLSKLKFLWLFIFLKF
jgi:hypothetical protein